MNRKSSIILLIFIYFCLTIWIAFLYVGKRGNDSMVEFFLAGIPTVCVLLITLIIAGKDGEEE